MCGACNKSGFSGGAKKCKCGGKCSKCAAENKSSFLGTSSYSGSGKSSIMGWPWWGKSKEEEAIDLAEEAKEEGITPQEKVEKLEAEGKTEEAGKLRGAINDGTISNYMNSLGQAWNLGFGIFNDLNGSGDVTINSNGSATTTQNNKNTKSLWIVAGVVVVIIVVVTGIALARKKK